eukprot:157964-Pelagomonas_calceolata.AAC.1
MDEEEKMLLCDGRGTGTPCAYSHHLQHSQGRCLCPRRVHDGVSIPDLLLARARTQPEPGPILKGKRVPLFRDAASRRRQQELKAFEGCTIVHKERQGGQAMAKLGTVSCLGASMKIFEV